MFPRSLAFIASELGKSDPALLSKTDPGIEKDRRIKRQERQGLDWNVEPWMRRQPNG